ncbi:MAG: SH3 domain-containing protein [Chloroflexi bacterium]|nr:SH3 domain-containing protein [Chloroflexota bacterium]
MNNRFHKIQGPFILLLIVVLTQACMRFRLDAPASVPTPRNIEPTAIETRVESISTVPAVPTETPLVVTQDSGPTATELPGVTIQVVKGNIFIRRGPGLAYNPIGVLYKNTETKVIARDVLNRWVQVVIPNSDMTGWVSIQTEYSKLNGELDSLPDIIQTEWPIPAYLRNCTHHDMYIMPGEITLPSLLMYPDNEVWLNPGSYTVQDLLVPGKPEVLDFEIREGMKIDINNDGAGEHRKC